MKELNQYDTHFMMKIIKLTRNKKAIIDDEAFKKVSKYKWYCMGNGYAATRPWNKKNKTYSTLYMHRFIMDQIGSKHVDHINGNKLDNRFINLRLCTHKENIRNSKKIRSNNTSGHKGVYLDKRNGKWLAKITVNYKYFNLGSFSNKDDAIQCYCNAAKKYFGEFAS